jgi:hypothetical protein
MGRTCRGLAVTAPLVLSICQSCHSSLPGPIPVAQPNAAFGEVPFPPPPAKTEYVPQRPPAPDARWVDGQWRWGSSRWEWEHGGWYAVPLGVGFARWQTRRERGGRLLFAPATWRSVDGGEVARPALLAHARGGPAVTEADADAGAEDAEALPSEASLVDAPTIFDGPLYDAAGLDASILPEGPG